MVMMEVLMVIEGIGILVDIFFAGDNGGDYGAILVVMVETQLVKWDIQIHDGE